MIGILRVFLQRVLSLFSCNQAAFRCFPERSSDDPGPRPLSLSSRNSRPLRVVLILEPAWSIFLTSHSLRVPRVQSHKLEHA